MSKKKLLHHELPRYYPEGFCDPDKSRATFIQILGRDMPFRPGKKYSNNPRCRSIRKTALRSDAYGVRSFDGKVDFQYEGRLQQKEHGSEKSSRCWRFSLLILELNHSRRFAI